MKSAGSIVKAFVGSGLPKLWTMHQKIILSNLRTERGIFVEQEKECVIKQEMIACLRRHQVSAFGKF